MPNYVDDNKIGSELLKFIPNLEMFEKTKVIYIVIPKSEKDSICDFFAFEYGNEEWELTFNVEGYLGRAGVIEPEERTEGSGTTPTGMYTFGMLFGLCEEPDGLKKFYKVIDSDDYWDGDCNSDTYNQYVKGSNMPDEWNREASEHLIDYYPAYNYGAMINFNVNPAIKGRGSAIFFHCTRPGCTGSAGCVCIPEEYAKKALQKIDDNTLILILKNIEEIKKYKK